MKGLSWSIFALVAIALCHNTFAAPSSRTKRDDDLQFDDPAGDLNPIEAEETLDSGLDREKRKLPDATFAAKNAVLGFVFGKIDNLIDSKTRYITALDRTNIEKNRQYNITSPVPINDFQTLINAVITPKINSVTQVLGSLTTGVLGGIGGLSGASGQGGGAGGSAAGGAGLGQILAKFLRLSGPILQSSGGAASTSAPPSSDEAGY